MNEMLEYKGWLVGWLGWSITWMGLGHDVDDHAGNDDGDGDWDDDDNNVDVDDDVDGDGDDDDDGVVDNEDDDDDREQLSSSMGSRSSSSSIGFLKLPLDFLVGGSPLCASNLAILVSSFRKAASHNLNSKPRSPQ